MAVGVHVGLLHDVLGKFRRRDEDKISIPYLFLSLKVVVFAEGGFGRAPGLRAFHLGAFAASAATGAPVVPVVLQGTRSLLRDTQWLPVRHPIDLCILAPAAPDGGDWTAAVRLRDRVRAAMLSRCGEPDLTR